MNISVILDIGIGLVIVYIAGAVLVSAIQELIASLLQWRSQHLKQSILQMMLNNLSESQIESQKPNIPTEISEGSIYPSVTENQTGDSAKIKTQFDVAKDLQKQIYENSLVQSMNHRSVNLFGEKKGKLGDILAPKYEKVFSNSDPSYLSSETFATTLIQELKKGLDKNLQNKLKEMLETPNTARTPEAIKEIKDMIKASEKIPTSLKETLITLADRASLKASEADNKLLIFQQEIETWFDRSMDRASGVYKRNTQLLCFFLGFAIAIMFNLDSLFLAHRLSQDTAMRTALAGGAETIVKESMSEEQNSQSFDPDKLQENINSLLGKSSFIAPITENAGNLVNCPDNQLTCPLKPGIPNFGKVFFAVVGWIITALAIYMGAPFWFDILGKLVNVRSTGKKS